MATARTTRRRLRRAAPGAGGFTTLTDFLTSLTPVRWYKCDEASGNLTDSGSGATNLVPQTATEAYRAAGMFANDPNYAIDLELSSLARFTASGHILNTTGSIIVFFRPESLTTAHVMFAQGSNDNVRYISAIADPTEFRFRMTDSAGAYDVTLNDSSIPISAGNWYMGVITQAADGTGVKMYLNGVLGTTTTDTLSGNATVNDWFFRSGTAGSTLTGLGNLPSAIAQPLPYDGRLAHVCVLSQILTQQQITDLYTLATVVS